MAVKKIIHKVSKKIDRFIKQYKQLDQKTQLLLVVITVAVIGTLLLATIHAVTSTATIEPENGSVNHACVLNDASASGSQAVKFSKDACGLAIVPDTLATQVAHTGNAYTANLALSTGNSASWSIISGSLPPGLNLSGNKISGTPIQAGAFTFEIKADFNFIGQKTKTYTILVYPPSSTGYEARLSNVINAHSNHPWPPLTGDPNCGDSIGLMTYSMASLFLNKNTADVNNRLANFDITKLYCSDGVGTALDSLWMNHVLRVYLLYNSTSSFYPGRLTAAAQSNLIAQMWLDVSQNISWDMTASGNNVWVGSSENHDAQTKSFLFLANQIFMDDPAYANRKYTDGHTVSEYYHALDGFWSHYFDERAKRGLWVEVGSGYHGYTLDGVYNIYNFGDDPLLRKKAEMILDLDAADISQQLFNATNTLGGGKSRIYTQNAYSDANTAINQLSDILYGPGLPGSSNHGLLLATSGYYPPDVVVNMARAPNKGVYEYASRRPGAGSNSSPTLSVIHYSYVTPNYILGTAMLDRNQTYPAASGQNRWQGIIFNTSWDARVYPQAGLTASNNKAKNAFYAVQSKGAMLTHKVDLTTIPTLVYFAQSLDQLDEESGWLFVREGGSYLAVKPESGSYSWLTANKNKDSNIDNRFIKLSNGASPIIFEAAQASDYGNNFDSFKAKIKSNAQSYTNGVAQYTASDGTRLTLYDAKTTPQINGNNISFAPLNVFNSPYLTSVWGSGIVNVNYGGHSASYNFSNSNNPTKSVH